MQPVEVCTCDNHGNCKRPQSMLKINYFPIYLALYSFTGLLKVGISQGCQQKNIDTVIHK